MTVSPTAGQALAIRKKEDSSSRRQFPLRVRGLVVKGSDETARGKAAKGSDETARGKAAKGSERQRKAVKGSAKSRGRQRKAAKPVLTGKGSATHKEQPQSLSLQRRAFHCSERL